MKELTEQEALRKVAAYCSNSEHCKSEITEKLYKWGVNPEAISRISTKLEKENYLNEERYCKSFIHDKIHFNKWGKFKVAQALKQKGISGQLIQSQLNEVDEKEYLTILNKLLNDKKKNIRAKNEYELHAKLIRFATSKGFSMEDIAKCVSLPE